MRYPPLRYYLERVLRDMGGYLALGRSSPGSRGQQEKGNRGPQIGECLILSELLQLLLGLKASGWHATSQSLLSGTFRKPQFLVRSQKYCRYKLETYCSIAIPGSPYRGQNWKIRKMTFWGSKNAFLGGRSWNHLNGLFGGNESPPL